MYNLGICGVGTQILPRCRAGSGCFRLRAKAFVGVSFGGIEDMPRRRQAAGKRDTKRNPARKETREKKRSEKQKFVRRKLP
jgi:hypothetical protein